MIIGALGMALIGILISGILFLLIYLITRLHVRRLDETANLRYLYGLLHPSCDSDSYIKEYFKEHPEELEKAKKRAILKTAEAILEEERRLANESKRTSERQNE